MISPIQLPPEASTALSLLEKNGFEAFVVGGFVRDSLIGKHPFDVDITTNALPDEILNVFHGFRTIETGIRHGTVTVLIDVSPVEITTYRSEFGYSDGRHPDAVRFVSRLEDDLLRRDFTVNSLCCDRDGKVIDLLGGFDDLRKGIIRTIGEPRERFSEDKLRMLRALRFSSAYGFEIEEKTAQSIFEMSDELLEVSSERIYNELCGILLGKNVEGVLSDYYEVFKVILPEISGMKGFDQRNSHHKYDILGHTAMVVASSEADLELRLSALFHDCGKVETFSLDENGVGHFYGHSAVSADKANTALSRLRAPTLVKDNVVTLVRIHDAPIEESKKALKRKLNRYGEAVVRRLISLQRADTLGLADEFSSRLPHFDALEKLLDEIIKENECFSLKDLDVNGNDLISLGLKGREIGDSLKMLLEAVIDGRVKNEKEELLGSLNNEKN